MSNALSSPMGRARRTAKIILAGRSVPLTVLDELAEVDHGDLSGLLPAERLARFPELAEQRRRDKYGTVMPGGESYATAAPRARLDLERIATDTPTGPVLVVAHEMIGRLLRMHLLKLTPAQALAHSHAQDTVYRFAPGGPEDRMDDHFLPYPEA